MMHRMMHEFFHDMYGHDRRHAGCGIGPKMVFKMKGMNKPSSEKEADGQPKDGQNNEKSTYDCCGEEFEMDFDPMGVFFKVMNNMEKSNSLAAYATPEIRALFEEWIEQIENEILNHIKETNETDPEKLAGHFKLSKNSISYFLTKLAQKDKIKLKAENI